MAVPTRSSTSTYSRWTGRSPTNFIDYNWEIPYLCNRYVVPEFRDGKLGEDLVWMRLNDLKKQGYDYCFGHIHKWNKPAKLISRKLKGFTEEYESLDIKKK